MAPVAIDSHSPILLILLFGLTLLGDVKAFLSITQSLDLSVPQLVKRLICFQACPIICVGDGYQLQNRTDHATVSIFS